MHVKAHLILQNPQKSPWPHERKKLYVESAKAAKMDDLSTWKSSSTKEENNKIIITIILIDS